jgi:hypothetical protein
LAPLSDDLRGLFPPVTAASRCWAARIERAAVLISPVGHPTSHHVAGHKPKPAHRNKPGRPRARTTQVTHCMRGPPAGAAAHGLMATTASQAKSQLREAPGGGPTAAPQGCPERQGPGLPKAIGAPKSSPLQAGSSSSGCERPPARMPTTLRRAPVAGHCWGASPQTPAAKMPQQVLTSVPPQISYSPPPEIFIVGPELWLPAA